MLEVGTKAPAFTLPDQNGNMISLSDYLGQKVILYFYSKDMTSGCTKQACAFADLYPQFQEKGAVVLGVSKVSRVHRVRRVSAPLRSLLLFRRVCHRHTATSRTAHEIDSRILINLASKEYSKSIEKYLQPKDQYITCVFGELEGGKIVQKGVYAKMARGEMVRFMAGIQAEEPEQIKAFNWSGYQFDEERSTDHEYVFIRTKVPGKEKH